MPDSSPHSSAALFAQVREGVRDFYLGDEAEAEEKILSALACIEEQLEAWDETFREILDVTERWTRPLTDEERLLRIDTLAKAALRLLRIDTLAKAALARGPKELPESLTDTPTTTFQWLIERGQPEGLANAEWLEHSAAHPARDQQWTRDAWAAAMFPDRETAERFIEDQSLEARAVEHGFASDPTREPS